MQKKHIALFGVFALGMSLFVPTPQTGALARQSQTKSKVTSLKSESSPSNTGTAAYGAERAASELSAKKPLVNGDKFLVAVGKASYYANGFHGRKTANGEKFDKKDFTAAHRTLPFGTIVRVTNLNNGKMVFVKINDRGPYIKNRIIDLSKAAAKQLDMVDNGVGKVRIEAWN
jgi:rare lipoprotein A